MAETILNIPIPDTDKTIHGRLREVEGAPIVVFVHCLTANKNTTEYYVGARFLEEAGYATYRFGLYGWEDDARRLLECTVDTHADDLDLVISTLKDRFPGRPVVAIGHSLGGMTIMSSKARGYDAVVLWEPTHADCWDERELADEYTKWEPALGLYRYIGGVDELVSREYLESYRFRDCDSLAEDFPVPMLTILGGTDGKARNPAMARYHERTPSQSDLQILDGVDHALYEGESLTRVLDVTAAWLGKLFPITNPA